MLLIVLVLYLVGTHSTFKALIQTWFEQVCADTARATFVKSTYEVWRLTLVNLNRSEAQLCVYLVTCNIQYIQLKLIIYDYWGWDSQVRRAAQAAGAAARAPPPLL